uniref:tRNA-specific adenosine deaminase 1 n=2 Tax=Clytia hemisphaerica TaxID=252671 RepID=A0A7M5XCD4_9CNID
MACVVKTMGQVGQDIEVISLATGTKCIGECHRVQTGRLLNDSHAEVLARRLFMKYLYKEIRMALDCHNTNSIFVLDGNKVRLKEDIQFHLLTTEIPCGDASIFPKTSVVVSHKPSNNTDSKREHTDELCRQPDTNKRQRIDPKGRTLDNQQVMEKCIYDEKLHLQKPLWVDSKTTQSFDQQKQCDPDNDIGQLDLKQNHENAGSGYKACNVSNCANTTNSSLTSKNEESKSKILQDADIFRTGAKCVPSGRQDPLGEGGQYHTTGALRIKPGRGFRTMSMSCSDKILKWCTLGIQGGLLSNFIHDGIFLSSIILTSPNFDESAFSRALSFRGRDSFESLVMRKVDVLHVDERPFADGKERVQQRCLNEKITSSGVAILWCGVCAIHSFSSNGRKHGIIKKHFNSDIACTPICKLKLFNDFHETLNHSPLLEKSVDGGLGRTYHHFKHSSIGYEKQRELFFKVFHDWTRKPSAHEQFTI